MTRTIHSYSKKISDNKSFESELYIDRNYRFFYSIFESEFKLLNLNNFISIRLRIFGDLFARAGAQRQGSGDRFRGGSSVLYEANIALTIKDNKVTFVKNRYMDVNILNKIELDPSQITDKDIYKPKI